jgi:shikimate kinase
MIYFLTGFMGSGKTTIGKELSVLTETPFVDLDHEIEKACDMAVQDIFTEQGEAWFREKEAELLRKIPAQHTDVIVACGGGTPCFHENMAWMNAHGETWYLKIGVSELLRRLEPEALVQRPILKGTRPEDVRKEIESLLLQREKFYMQAHRVISEENAHARYLSRYL